MGKHRGWQKPALIWNSVKPNNFNNKGVVKSFFFSFLKRRYGSNKEFWKSYCEDPTVRCVKCGLKFNFQKSENCPRCKSDLLRVLQDEDPMYSPLSWLISAIIFIFLLWIALWVFPNI
jgi:uncharacterized paraquat-inducible protein A